MDSTEERLTPLAPGEWAIMECVWSFGGANAADVAAELRRRNPRGGYALSTCGVLLGRLAEKGYLAVEILRKDRGRPIHYYKPLVARETVLAWQVDHFIREYLLNPTDLDLVATLLARPKDQDD